MEIPYIAEYQTACEIAYATSDAQYCDLYKTASYSAWNDGAQDYGEFGLVNLVQNRTLAGDDPTPMPKLPDSGGKRVLLPFSEELGTPSLADSESALDAMLGRVYEKEFVYAARGFEVDGNIVIATLTSPFFLKSERDAALISLETELCQMAQDLSVTVCFDLDIYRRINENMAQDAMRELLETAKKRSELRSSPIDPQ